MSIQPLSYKVFKQAYDDFLLTPFVGRNGLIRKTLKFAGTAIAATWIAPVGGVAYHTFKCLKNVCHGDKVRAIRHLKAAGIDLAIAAVSLSCLYLAYTGILALPAIFKNIIAIRGISGLPAEALNNLFTSILKIGVPFLLPVIVSRCSKQIFGEDVLILNIGRPN